jgi:hypothetical protein
MYIYNKLISYYSKAREEKKLKFSPQTTVVDATILWSQYM